MAPKDTERDQIAREVEGDKYRELLLQLQGTHSFLREFGTWGEVVNFMWDGTSDDPKKDDVLHPILMAHAGDSDPRWRTILLLIFWPGLKSICIQRRGWEPEFDSLWSNAVWTFLHTVCIFNPEKNTQRIPQKLINGTIGRLSAEYRKIRNRQAREIPTDPALMEYLAGGAEDPGFAGVDLYDEQKFMIRKFREHLDAGRITEGGFELLVGTLVYRKRLRECAEEAGLTYQTAKKRRQRAEAAIRRYEESK